jgi:two-component system, OmpR family, alkaline phosphatase synthesis response regulator PhoP
MGTGLKKILIIDDELDICNFTKRVLDRTGKYETTVSQDSQDGIMIAKKDIPDIILLDINMPILDGGAVAQELSENKTTSNIPIVFVTALLKREELDEDGMVNKHFFLPKPISSEELVKKIDEVLRIQAAKR